MRIKNGTKKNPLCMSSNKFFVKYDLKNIHWFGNSVMKLVYAAAFKK